MTSEDNADLSPGIRDLVVWLNEQGFRTTDSGDGSNHDAGMGCAVDFPMVAILVEPASALIAESDRLGRLLGERGIDFEPPECDCCDPPDEITWPTIQGTYDPHNGTAIIVLSNVLSEDAGL